MKHWFAVYTKPRKEMLAEEHLRHQGYETYLPRIQQVRRCRRRWKETIEPLFPRYLFVHLMEGRDNFTPIRSTSGVADLVRFGGVPRPVPQGLIEEIKSREDQELGVLIDNRLWLSGMEMEILDGPFAGLKGIIDAESADERVIILLRLLGRDNKITVAQDAVVPA